ncbi:E3 ubiquitin-protein ligase SlrP [Paraglaciecola mesophila]|uniref:E3 ubiquitin-protein ligase SlrP n=1 Tax=Paraglaciecola mesophila TaxID=197222 RepID=A0A857JHD4_9ALTE|nr:protein kinase [Paraglaciecola mesophila]QHJ10371.1 E3 ubiquitin-protein ligase SlrP [Paraglaciecola mesophila]
MHTLKQLKSGQLAGLSKLTLSENLTEFPSAILTLADTLEVLDLSNNKLSSLPKALAKLKKLKIIFASNNRFEVLPEVLGACENLEMIGFKANNIKYVPENSLPKKLRWLILTDNQIESLPNTLGECPRMQKLALAGNKLKTLPENMSQLHNLELLRISANDLAKCPEQLLDLPKLAWFAFAGNPFSAADLHIDTVPHVSSTSYQLHNVLGQGASGVISKATWVASTDFPEEVAVKVFKGEVTSDGYPKDELQVCLKVGQHTNLVKPLAQVTEPECLALVLALIPPHYHNLGLPPSLKSCTRDTFPEGFSLSPRHIDKIISQMQEVYSHLHGNQVCHGDLYAHNTLVDDEGNIIFGDFGAASMYHMLSESQQNKIKLIEARALNYFIEDIQSLKAG